MDDAEITLAGKSLRRWRVAEN